MPELTTKADAAERMRRWIGHIQITCNDWEDAQDTFDEALNEARAEGAAAERERIRKRVQTIPWRENENRDEAIYSALHVILFAESTDQGEP